MARIPDPRLSTTFGPIQKLVADLVDYLRKIKLQVNQLSEGQLSARYAANTSPPAAGSKQTYSKGDVIPNSNPSELGASGSKYVITQWICVAGRTPGTWVACRSLTGN
jgi:hypothetical protein